MAGSAKRTHYPHDPCDGTNPAFHCPTTRHDDAGYSCEVEPTRVDCTVSSESVTPP